MELFYTRHCTQLKIVDPAIHTFNRAVGRFSNLGRSYLWAKPTAPRGVRWHAPRKNFGILHCLKYILRQSGAYEIMYHLPQELGLSRNNLSYQ